MKKIEGAILGSSEFSRLLFFTHFKNQSDITFKDIGASKVGDV
jgi:hypothetical protein